MSKAVLISIRPKWCGKIASGEKTIEARKNRPKLGTPFKCYIYETQGWVEEDGIMAFRLGGRVIGEFTCDRIYELETRSPGSSYYVKGEGQPTTYDVARQSCLTIKDMHEYLQSKAGYGWHISGLKIYDEPRELREFKKINRDCFYADLGLAKRDCPDCKNSGCFFERPPQSWCYVEELNDG